MGNTGEAAYVTPLRLRYHHHCSAQPPPPWLIRKLSPALTPFGDPPVPLSIVLTSAALLLAVPLSLLVLLVAFNAIGPLRRRGKGVQLPDLSDDLLCPGYAA
jgi:hypothetical protein